MAMMDHPRGSDMAGVLRGLPPRFDGALSVLGGARRYLDQALL